MKHPEIHALCAEYGIKVIDRHRYPDIGETRAVETLARIMRRYGEGHLRMVLTTLAETANNKAALDEVGLWAASDMVVAWSNVVEQRAGDWLAAWDAMPVGELQHRNQKLSGIISQRFALGGQLHERLYAWFGPHAAQPDLLDDRRQS